MQLRKLSSNGLFSLNDVFIVMVLLPVLSTITAHHEAIQMGQYQGSTK